MLSCPLLPAPCRMRRYRRFSYSLSGDSVWESDKRSLYFFLRRFRALSPRPDLSFSTSFCRGRAPSPHSSLSRSLRFRALLHRFLRGMRACSLRLRFQLLRLTNSRAGSLLPLPHSTVLPEYTRAFIGRRTL